MSKHPPLKPLQSSALSGHHYDPESKVLHLGFTSGHVHRYLGVQGHVAQGLEEAKSAGSYFHQRIRGRYAEEKITDGK